MDGTRPSTFAAAADGSRPGSCNRLSGPVRHRRVVSVGGARGALGALVLGGDGWVVGNDSEVPLLEALRGWVLLLLDIGYLRANLTRDPRQVISARADVDGSRCTLFPASRGDRRGSTSHSAATMRPG